MGVGTVAVASGLLVWGATPRSAPARPVIPPEPASSSVRVVGPGEVELLNVPGLERKLLVVTLEPGTVDGARLSVSGQVVARLGAGQGPMEDRWRFHTPELLTLFSDWRRAGRSRKLAEAQHAQLQQLDVARQTALRRRVERLAGLVDAGTDPVSELTAAEAELLEARIEGQRAIHEAEATVLTAAREQATLARQLSQSGIEPGLMDSAREGAVVVIAEVPEARVSEVREGLDCEARFDAVPGVVFRGKVKALASSLSAESRTLQVAFDVEDPAHTLRPGMSGVVGLGAGPRQVLRVPAEGVLQIGREDYALVASGGSRWKAMPIQVREVPGEELLEVVTGLEPGARVVGAGAILLKPVVVRALRPEAHPPRLEEAPR